MTKKLLGLAIVALFCVGMASAATMTQLCTTPAGSVVNSGANGATPGLSATETCGSVTLPVGDTITAIDLFESGDWQLGVPGGNTLVYTLAFGGAVSGTSSETVTGTGGSSLPPFPFTGPCAEVSNTDQGDCSFAGTGTNTVGSATTAWVGTWSVGSAGLLTNGSEGVSSYEIITYSVPTTTPEPASLLMIGTGLVGLAVLVRRKNRA